MSDKVSLDSTDKIHTTRYMCAQRQKIIIVEDLGKTTKAHSAKDATEARFSVSLPNRMLSFEWGHVFEL